VRARARAIAGKLKIFLLRRSCRAAATVARYFLAATKREKYGHAKTRQKSVNTREKSVNTRQKSVQKSVQFVKNLYNSSKIRENSSKIRETREITSKKSVKRKIRRRKKTDRG
jgi:hypothetical protein